MTHWYIYGCHLLRRAHQVLYTVKQFLSHNTSLLEPLALAVSPYGWLMTHCGWLAG